MVIHFFGKVVFFIIKKYKILEIPMRQPKRIHGTSKIMISDIVKAVLI